MGIYIDNKLTFDHISQLCNKASANCNKPNKKVFSKKRIGSNWILEVVTVLCTQISIIVLLSGILACANPWQNRKCPKKYPCCLRMINNDYESYYGTL